MAVDHPQGARFLFDSNVLIDILQEDRDWEPWSSEQLARAVTNGVAFINQIIYAEILASLSNADGLDAWMPIDEIHRVNLPWEAAEPAAAAFLLYRQRGGTRTSPLPDFYIGAHAQVAGLTLVTRDVSRYRTYFPAVTLLSPPQAASQASAR